MYVENCSLEPNLKKGTFKRLQNNYNENILISNEEDEIKMNLLGKKTIEN